MNAGASYGFGVRQERLNEMQEFAASEKRMSYGA